VAICDIDEYSGLGKKAVQFPKAKQFVDFRKLLEEMDREIDASPSSTPDHTHAPLRSWQSRWATRYVQKPLTHTIHEARALREAAAKYKVATQMGNQGPAATTCAVPWRSSRRRDRPVREAHVWTNRPGWPQAPTIVSRPTEVVEVPSTIHWTCSWAHPQNGPTTRVTCRRNGAAVGLRDRGARRYGLSHGDMPFMALKLGYPTSVVRNREK